MSAPQQSAHERAALVRELHLVADQHGICGACSRPAPCPTIRILDGACPCPRCGTVPPTRHRKGCSA